jgi:hypothetical protein
MKYEELKQRIKEINKEVELKVNKEIKAYCNANNPYKVGDIFTDHIGSIIVEKIGYVSNLDRYKPYCIYCGIELKKDGTPKKGDKKRVAHQINENKIIK